MVIGMVRCNDEGPTTDRIPTHDRRPQGLRAGVRHPSHTHRPRVGGGESRVAGDSGQVGVLVQLPPGVSGRGEWSRRCPGRLSPRSGCDPEGGQHHRTHGSQTDDSIDPVVHWAPHHAAASPACTPAEGALLSRPYTITGADVRGIPSPRCYPDPAGVIRWALASDTPGGPWLGTSRLCNEERGATEYSYPLTASTAS